jgi:hypothetical protein
MGTVGGPGGPGPRGGDPDYANLNASAKNAFENIVGEQSNVAGISLRSLIKRAVEFLNEHLGDGYQPPSNATLNEQIDVCLGRIVSSYEQRVGQLCPPNADPAAVKGMANANHQDCLNYLDQVLQLAAIDLKQKTYARPVYTPKKTLDGDYFQAYLDVIAGL